MKARLFWLPVFFLMLSCSQWRKEATWAPEDLAIVISPEEDEAVRWAASDLREIIGQATGITPALVESPEETKAPHLLLVGEGAWECPSLGEEDYAFLPINVGAQDGLRLCGGGLLGRQYAVYSYLSGLGVRFVHPEQTLVPTLSSLPAGRPSGLREVEEAPSLLLRGFHIHTQHPLALLEALLTDDPDEAERAHRTVDWLVRNRQNTLQWILLDSVPFDELQLQAGRVIEYAHRRGVKVFAQTSFSSNQQNAHRLIDPSNPVDDILELKESISLLLENPWDGINVNLGASEFSPTDEDETIEWMNVAAAHARAVAGVPVYATNHVPADLFAEGHGVNFFDLPQFADPSLGVFVHTTMFYGLEGPAPVYGNSDFSRQLEFLQNQVGVRSIVYFPESAWWLTFDNAIPLFLPVYLTKRSEDLRLLGGVEGVEGHITFSSGWEWGYWLTDVLISRQSWEPGLSLEEVLAEILAPLGEGVADLVSRIAESQTRALIDEDLMPFLSGEDTLTEIGLRAGIVFHALAPAPADVMGFSQQFLDDLSGELDQLEIFCDELDGFSQEWEALAGAESDPFAPRAPLRQVGAARLPRPIGALLLLQELRDSTRITWARCQNALLNYRALVAARDLVLALPTKDNPEALLLEAKSLTDLARQIVARREAAYRYEGARTFHHEDTGGDGVENLTDYPYRVYGRTHILFFWERRDRLVEEAILGVESGLRVAPQQILAGGSVGVDASAAELDEGSSISLLWGDGLSDSLTAGKSAALAHPYPDPGQFVLHIEALTEGLPLVLDVALSVATEIFLVPAEEVRVVVPENPLADTALRSFIPNLLLGFNGGDPALPLASLSLDRTGDGEADPGTVFHLPPGQRSGDHVVISGFSLQLPVESASGSLGSLIVREAVLEFDLLTTKEPQDTLSGGQLRGVIRTSELIDLLVGSEVIEEDGAIDILAPIFGFDPATPPEDLPVELSVSGQLLARLP